jgi:hypothetical protein
MTSTVHLTIRVQAPQPNAELNPGDVLTVAGVATGSPGTEPVSIDTVTVALAGPPIEAVLTFVPHQHVPTVRFEATLTVPAVGGDHQLHVVAFADDGKQANVWIPVIIGTHVTQPPPPWATSQLAPAGAMPGAARLTAIAKPAGCELWWIGADGAVNGVWTEPGAGAWASYQLAGTGGAAPGGGITAVSKGGDVMEVWWVGPDGSVQAAYHDSGWHLYTLAGPGSAAVTGGIAGIFKGGDVMEVWWVGPDGSVKAAYHEADWQTYTLAGSGAAATTGGITAVFKGGDFMEVWWAAPDGSVTGAYHEADWQTYTLAGPGSASRTCRITSAFGGSLLANVMRVWWVDAAGTPYQAFFDGAWAVSPIGTGAIPSGAAVGVLFNPDTPTGFWARTDGSLVDAYPPEITLSAHVSGGRGLRGTVWLTLREGGSTRWHGDVTNDEVYGYNFGLSVFAQTGTSADIGAAHDGHVAGWGEPGSSNDIWDEEHQPNPALVGGLAAYRFSGLLVRLEHSVDLVDYLKAAIDAIFEAAVGIALTEFGAVVVVGIEIGSLLATGSLVPGAIIAGGVPWLTGPAGIFVRVLVTASSSDGRPLTAEEYAWANDMVFRGSLPPIDTFQITNYVGAENRPFTFPTFGGPTLVNVGNAIYSNIHVNQGERTMIHELTHVCQIAHTQDLVFTATAIATQLKNEFTDVYDYGAAGFDYTDLGFEAQAEVVEDWFLGKPARPMNPDPRKHTGPMDAQSPYYRYITDNLRTGHF